MMCFHAGSCSMRFTKTTEVSERAVDSHMKNLRKKLAQALPDAEPIRSIYGVGFVYEP